MSTKSAAPIQAVTAGAIVVTPPRTIPELMWTSAALCGGKAVSFAKAEQAVRDLSIGGFDDWRLPTREELLTLVDLEKFDPAIDEQKFPCTKSGFYWSSTPYAGNPDYAWGVYFYYGGSGIGRRGNGGFVRAVRSVLPASPSQ